MKAKTYVLNDSNSDSMTDLVRVHRNKPISRLVVVNGGGFPHAAINIMRFCFDNSIEIELVEPLSAGVFYKFYKGTLICNSRSVFCHSLRFSDGKLNLKKIFEISHLQISLLKSYSRISELESSFSSPFMDFEQAILFEKWFTVYGVERFINNQAECRHEFTLHDFDGLMFSLNFERELVNAFFLKLSSIFAFRIERISRVIYFFVKDYVRDYSFFREASKPLNLNSDSDRVFS